MSSTYQPRTFDLKSVPFRVYCETVFHQGTRAKAERLVADGKVLLQSVSRAEKACDISARVTGAAPVPYDVHVLCGSMSGSFFINGRCSCPMVLNCKHVFAALKAATDRIPVVLPPPAKNAGRPKAGPAKPRLPAEWQRWVQRMAEATVPSEAAAPDPEAESVRLLYILKPANAKGGVPLEFAQARLSRDRSLTYITPISPYEATRVCLSPRIVGADRLLARRIFLAHDSPTGWEFELHGKAGAELLVDILATGNARWRGVGKDHPPLQTGPLRTATASWQIDDSGWQRPVLQVTPAASIIFPLTPLWYVDEKESICGPLEANVPPAAAAQWMRGPKLPPEQAHFLHEALAAKTSAHQTLPLPVQIEIEEVPPAKPVAYLRLHSIPSAGVVSRPDRYWEGDAAENLERINLASLEFDYNGTRYRTQDKKAATERFENGKLRRIQRDLEAEAERLERLLDLELVEAGEIYWEMGGKWSEDFAYEDEHRWFTFARQIVPELKAEGWQIEIDPTFTFRLVEPEAWYADAQPESGTEWFDTEIGVQLEGEKVNLLPLLLRQIQANPNILSPQSLQELRDDALLLVHLPDGRKLPFPVHRIKSLLGVLLELYDPKVLDGKGRLRLSKLRAAELSGAAGTDSWRWLGGETLRALSDKLRNFRSIQPVPPPPGLRANLRPYQQEGLHWLQFLREYNLAGILADDMGLGKTVQTLAHLLLEKESGRADSPSLVVAPTSLMTNWRQEAERFAPGLRCLILHGLDRKQHFEKLRDYDLIVTSYPLLPRDESVLLKEQFHLVVLDEAQYIKNPKTKYAQIVCQLRARHHLCLTGTPMENHLGELWSIFNFLLPGFLGDETRFRKVFRNPIENGGDAQRRQVLARRIGPFLLRRRKDEVAAELPPKTEIVHKVELSGAQRDLYETIRLAMHTKVRAAVDEKGISRVHIIILDALLKLRQVCCDPRLVKLEAARAVRESAKLELLMDLLPEMLAEGRRILLFSQFTSMLALIQQELARAGIKYALLTGDTADRGTPISQFQDGNVPLFLISLKAGGTGLNLTAADTVIHYDPWWNPAVENQATDRAHRIGQTKSVFVYKFITVGTVEEKILALQQRKSGLVEGLLNEDRKDALALTPEDLQSLFSPIG
jgi:superfamily II DNA or RNA helicase